MGKGLAAVAAYFDIPAETLPNVPKFTITGNNRITVENHHGIKEFSEELIEIDCGKQSLRLRGSGFMLKKLSADELKISGKLIYIELE